MLNWKQSSFALITVALGLATFWMWRNIVSLLALGELSNPYNLAFPIVGLVISAAMFSFSAILVDQKWIAYAAAITAVSPSYFFIQPSDASIAAFAMSSLLTTFAVFRMRREFALSLGFSLTKILKTGLPLYFTSAAILISFFYFTPLRGNEERAAMSLFPKVLSRAALKIISGQLKSSLGIPVDITPGITVDALLRQLAETQSRAEGVSLSRLPASGLEKIFSEQKKEIAKKYGINLGGNEKVEDAFRSLAIERIKTYMGSYWAYLPVISAIAFFAALKVLTVPLTYLTVLAALVLLKIGVFVKIFKNEKKQIEVERLTL